MTKYLKTDWNSNLQAFLDSKKKSWGGGTLRIVDGLVGHGNFVQQMENTSSLFSFEIRGGQAVPSAQN